MTEIVPAVPPLGETMPQPRDFLGHPRSLWVLVMTECWVAFSLYGLQSILVLYMKDSLLQPQKTAHIWGFGALEAIVGGLYAPHGTAAWAGAIMGLFLSLVFATPLLGGFLADRVLGRTRTIILGAALMTGGHLLMMSERCFVLALLCLLTGIGLAGSLKAQVGALYALDDRRRSDAYQIYSLGVQIAVIVSPVLCASMGEIAWHWGFLTAGAGMALGLVCYLAGRHLLPPDVVVKTVSARVPLTFREKKSVALLLCLVFIMAVGSLPNNEIFDGYLIWGQEHYRLSLFGHPFPVSDLLSLDGFMSSVTAIAVLAFWQFYARHRKDLTEITKVTIGIAISAIAPLFLALASFLFPAPHQISLLWGIAFHTVNDIGFAMVYGIGMALFSRAAPVSLNTIMVACFSLHVCVSNLMVGKLATLVNQMSGVSFWLLHAGLAACAAVVLALLASFRGNILSPQEDQPSSRISAAAS